MKIAIKVFMGFLALCAVLGGIMSFLWGRAANRNDYFATDATVRPLPLPLPFPSGLIYQSSPDSSVLIGSQKREPALFEISAFDRSTAHKLWQLPFTGTIVGQTNARILVYEATTSAVHFINPRTGQTTRTVSPAPAPLTSPSSLYTGMAFTDDLYLTTKPLYKQVVTDGKVDTNWKIGITAKHWGTNEIAWFVPPVQQIVIIEHPPIVSGDNVLVINPEQKVGEGHSYQVISLKTGAELHRSVTEGTYYSPGNDQFFERTNTAIRRLDPFTQKERWRLNGNFSFGQLWQIGDQLTILSRHPDGAHNTIRIVASVSGHILSQFDVPFFNDTAIKGAYLIHDSQVFLHFDQPNFAEPGTLLYDYWVCYDPQTQQALWRTDFHSESISSLLPFITL
ncbi:hypothetical protein [Spirosoma migulaei]